MPVISVCADIETCEAEISASPDWVAPQKTSGNTMSSILVNLKKPAPQGGCSVDFKVYPVPKSGGHEHHDAMRPTGSISPPSIPFYEGEKGPKTATYTSSEIAGTEEIIAEVRETGKETKKTVDVKVPILGKMPNGIYWRLTGAFGEPSVTSMHTENHYAEASVIDAMIKIANEYYGATETTLGINDISLSWGGLFDIGNNWATPHSSHRKGTDVDISIKVYDPDENEYIEKLCLKDVELGRVAERNFVKLICEHGGKKHIKF